jgi:alpha-L-fucosidase 2
MKKFTFSIILILIITSVSAQNTLWYKQPAKIWDEALPIGNGKLGAMIFGGVDNERLQLNEESLWTGDRSNVKDKEDGYKNLPEIRKLLFDGKYAEAQEITERELMTPGNWNMYQTLGDLTINFKHTGEISNYKRELNLDNAIVKISYQADGIDFTREYFSSHPDNVIAVKYTASKAKSLNISIKLSRQKDATIKSENNTITMSGLVTAGGVDITNLNPGVKYETQLKVTDEKGKTKISGDSLIITGANSITFYLTAATNYWGKDPHLVCEENLKKVLAKNYAKVKSAHVADYQQLFNRVKLDLGTTEIAKLPMDERLKTFQDGAEDPSLISLYFQFGRYMLISSSRPGDLAANLQGIWADGLTPPWSADYHININIEMNYWPAEVTNLSECHLPFIALIDSLRPSGRLTAQKMYASRGFCAHFTTDAWYWTTATGKAEWGMWPMGAAWGCQHLWEHYAFTLDKKYLAYAYPILKEAALFFVDYLIKDPSDGYLVTGPSSSPENKFKTPDGKISNITMGPTMDLEICWDLFTNTIEASKILALDEDFRKQLISIRSQLRPLKIGSDGRLMEWSKEFEEPEPGHRHISHLFALHPGKQITMQTPELMEAARKTIEYRLSHGGGHTGWSRAWIINFFARLHDGEKAYENLNALLCKSTLSNLFDVHPPFQIDGNFGGTAGIAEMLIQSQAGEIELLPALPSAWKSGSVKGLRTRGGYEVDIEWKDGKLFKAKIHSDKGQKAVVNYQKIRKEFDTMEGKDYLLDGNLKLVQ